MQDDKLSSTISSEGKAYEIVEELELSSRVDGREAREKLAIPVDAAIEVRPADISRRDSLLIGGLARKLARHGVTAVCVRPVEVGSVFHIVFDTAVLDVDPVLAICDRCVMFEPTAFGVHFQFTEPIEVSQLDRETTTT